MRYLIRFEDNSWETMADAAVTDPATQGEDAGKKKKKSSPSR